MGRYRYRTDVLVGPWRETAERAGSDAVRSCQARIDDAGELVWLVPGKIEVAEFDHDDAPRA